MQTRDEINEESIYIYIYIVYNVKGNVDETSPVPSSKVYVNPERLLMI